MKDNDIRMSKVSSTMADTDISSCFLLYAFHWSGCAEYPIDIQDSRSSVITYSEKFKTSVFPGWNQRKLSHGTFMAHVLILAFSAHSVRWQVGARPLCFLMMLFLLIAQWQIVAIADLNGVSQGLYLTVTVQFHGKTISSWFLNIMLFSSVTVPSCLNASSRDQRVNIARY